MTGFVKAKILRKGWLRFVGLWVLALPINLIADDVVVSPPGVGILRVGGEVGDGQKSYLKLFRCAADREFILKKNSCYAVKGRYEINTSISLSEGIYMVGFNFSVKPDVIIRAGEETSLTLSRMKTPTPEIGAELASHFRAFADLTDSSEMAKVLLDYWGSTGGRSFNKKVCDHLQYKDICTAINSSPAALRGVVVDTDAQARELNLSVYSDGSGRKWTLKGRRWLNERSEIGGFVSVFPGVYGVEFTDESGLVTNRYGIVVK